ncbi:hypothetical protein [Paenibacillus sp. FJAT-27812]|uniref:hypothetical protein n=1 Tax=Paenibacillus sp. FJAT-27812 TaxID=1684143 RepID=UPI0006A78608|nr:hypothetical protein [Paenibacillus sp. FJAT-27812]
MENTNTLKVQELINLLLAMNPRAEVYYGSNNEYRPLVADDVQEIYAPEQMAKTVAIIGEQQTSEQDEKQAGTSK